MRSRDTPIASILDGLSNTILVSEILPGDGSSATFTYPRDMLPSVDISMITTPVMPPPDQVAALAAANEAAMASVSAPSQQLGDTWGCTAFMWTTYNTGCAAELGCTDKPPWRIRGLADWC